MASIAPSQSSTCTNPVLDLYTTADGALVDVASLEFTISENVTNPGTPVQVFPPSGRATVDLADCPDGHRLGVGHYVAEWDVPDDADVGEHIITWFFQLTGSSPEQTFTETFSVVLPIGASEESLYTTLADVRLEGLGVSAASNDRVNRIIRLAGAYIDSYTGRWFVPKTRTFTLDGRGHSVLHLQHPIISISAVSLDLLPAEGAMTSVDLDELVIYNRHLRQGLLQPDDRNNPKIEFVRADEDIRRALPRSSLLYFPHGRQNVTVSGVFGYTEPDGSATGRTPLLIQEAALRLVMRYFEPRVNAAFATGVGPLWKEMTREQRAEYATPDRLAIQGSFFGDPEIDSILAKYRRPPALGAV